jgi:hypothetical protein
MTIGCSAVSNTTLAAACFKAFKRQGATCGLQPGVTVVRAVALHAARHIFCLLHNGILRLEIVATP